MWAIGEHTLCGGSSAEETLSKPAFRYILIFPPFLSKKPLAKCATSFAGEPAGSNLVWLAEVITVLLQQAQKVGLSETKRQQQSARVSEGLAVPEALAWRDLFAAFLELIMRHLKTLCEVCRLAQEVRSLQIVQNQTWEKCHSVSTAYHS